MMRMLRLITRPFHPRTWLAAIIPSAVLAVGALSPGVALAHECWLSPSSYLAGIHQMVTVATRVGTGFEGEPRPFAASRIEALTLRADSTVDLMAFHPGEVFDSVRFFTDDDSGAVISYQSSFVPVVIQANDFNRYLRLQGLNGPLRSRAGLGSRAGPGRERYSRCAKALISGKSPSRLLEPVGLALEIVPLSDPETRRAFRVRVLYHGRPLAGALVHAWTQPLDDGVTPRSGVERISSGPVASARTDAGGNARFTLNRPGEWLLQTVHMVPSEDRDAADWQSYWASLTLARGVRRP